MQTSSPLLDIPSPVSSYHFSSPLGHSYQPLTSSPLSPNSSPVTAAQARRYSQYKARTPSTHVATSSRSLRNTYSTTHGGGPAFRGGGVTSGPTPLGDPQRSLLRENFKARCFERAVKAREKAIRKKRYSSEADSDRFDDSEPMEDDTEDDDTIMQEELFRRIMVNAARRERQSYRVLYAQEIGSPFDPDSEDINEWEQDLNETDDHLQSTASFTQRPMDELTPVDLDDEELEAYAEECAKRAVLADFEDMLPEDLFSWSDVELDEGSRHGSQDEDVEMR